MKPTAKVWRVETSNNFTYLITDYNGGYLYEASDYWEATCWARQYNYELIPKFRRANYYQGRALQAIKAKRPYEATHAVNTEPAAYSNYRHGWIKTA